VNTVGNWPKFSIGAAPARIDSMKMSARPAANKLRVASQRAMNLVAKAVKEGVLQRPTRCSRCHATPGPMSNGRTQIEAHHAYGYDQPLNIKWVCHQCNQKMKGPNFHNSTQGRARR
jgi:hypothetical protein